MQYVFAFYMMRITTTPHVCMCANFGSHVHLGEDILDSINRVIIMIELNTCLVFRKMGENDTDYYINFVEGSQG